MAHDIRITFDDDASEFVLATFGFTVGKKGVIMYGPKPAKGLDGRPVTLREFVGVVKTNKGPRLLRGSIVELLQVADGNVQVSV